MVTYELSLDICCPQEPVLIVQVVQGDTARNLKITITECGEPFEIPAGTEIVIYYANAFTRGSYTTVVKDGIEQSAYSINGNIITIAISDLVTEYPGLGALSIRLVQPGVAGLEAIHVEDLSATDLPVWGIEDAEPETAADASRKVHVRMADWKYLVHHYDTVDPFQPNVYPSHLESVGAGSTVWTLEKDSNTETYRLLSGLADGWRLMYNGSNAFMAYPSVDGAQIENLIMVPLADMEVPDTSGEDIWEAENFNKTIKGYALAVKTDEGYAVLGHNAYWRGVMGAMPNIDIQCFCKPPCGDCWDGLPPESVDDMYKWFDVGCINPVESYDRYLLY